MMETNADKEERLLVVSDLERLGPIVRNWFAPHPIQGVRSYLAGIAELPRAPTRAVLIGYDDSCRNHQSAVAAIKAAAGTEIPVVFCCEPAYENVGREALQSGADDYVIFPPEEEDLEIALKMPSHKRHRHWIQTDDIAPVPTAEELAGLTALLPQLSAGSAKALQGMAALLCTALNAGAAEVLFGQRMGEAGQIDLLKDDETVLAEPITHDNKQIGLLRVGRRLEGEYGPEDTIKLRHYGVLFGRLLEWTGRARRWRELALTDDLTGLPNRRRLIHFLSEKIRWAERQHATVTVLIFDIDDFKRYNDSYGHDAGDEILTEVGRLFVQCSRKDDLVARYGGDEFVVVFWDPKGPRTAGSQHPQRVIDVLQRFRRALQEHRFLRLGPEAQGGLTISGGIVHYPWQASTCSGLIESADKALLQAKEAGKNRFWIVGSRGGDTV